MVRAADRSDGTVKALYICYFGLREPLVQTQVLPYLRQIREGGTEVNLLTFEPELKRRWTEAELEREERRLAGEGIRWLHLTYHKRPTLPATLYDIAAGAWFIRRFALRERIDVLHARSHVAAAIAALVKAFGGGKMIFDIRGFLPEEYVDAGRWKRNGFLYSGVKRIEKRLLDSSDGFVVLTERARELLFPGCGDRDARGRPIEVIPCCIDPERFRTANDESRDAVREEMNLSGRQVFVYVGALGGWYLTSEMADFLAIRHKHNPQAFSLILTQSPPEMITEPLRARGIAEKDFLVRRASPEDVPRYLRAADVALSFIKPCYSKLSSSPTKIAEYLASGVPVVCNSGVGDLDELIETDRVGVLLHEFNEAAYNEALRSIEELQREGDTTERCRASARSRFDLATIGGTRYRRLYHRLMKPARNVPVNQVPIEQSAKPIEFVED